jgi:hypothetical protein
MVAQGLFKQSIWVDDASPGIILTRNLDMTVLDLDPAFEASE